MHTPGNLKPRKTNTTTPPPPIPKPLGGPYQIPKPTPKKKPGPGIPKASLGTIVKSVKNFFGTSNKIAKATKKVNKVKKVSKKLDVDQVNKLEAKIAKRVLVAGPAAVGTIGYLATKKSKSKPPVKKKI